MVSTEVGDHSGIPRAVSFFFFSSRVLEVPASQTRQSAAYFSHSATVRITPTPHSSASSLLPSLTFPRSFELSLEVEVKQEQKQRTMDVSFSDVLGLFAVAI